MNVSTEVIPKLAAHWVNGCRLLLCKGLLALWKEVVCPEILLHDHRCFIFRFASEEDKLSQILVHSS